jgi:serine/threonine-protein kinase
MPLHENPGAREADVRIGAVIADKYRIGRLIGRGGMARVYQAESLETGRHVAVKLLHAELTDDGITLARFEREARAAAQVGHEHVVEIVEVGVEPTGTPFLVMEYVRGCSLFELLHAERELSVARACDIACQVLEALGAVHARGIVHRDLKPENVLLTTQRGRKDYVKLCDFGIVAFSDAYELADLTPAGRTMASPHYASPEQLAGARGRDLRVDLYAVGVMLFEMIAGRKPFEAPSLAELFDKILREAAPPLRVFRRDVPDALEKTVARALGKTPKLRHASAADLLAELLPHRGVTARAVDDRIARAVAVALMAFLRERLSPAVLGQALLSLEPSARELASGLLPLVDWVPARPFADLLDHAERLAGTVDRRLAADAGRHLARHAAATLLGRARLEGLTPEQFLAELPSLWRAAQPTGEARVSEVTAGHGLVEVVGQTAPRIARTVAAASFLEEALRLLGATDVAVRLSRAESLGDDRDAFEATWSS